MPDELAAMRVDYAGGGFDVEDVEDDPLVQFRRWLDDAVAAGVDEPNAMTLATVDGDGRPAARTVLLKGMDGRGFIFFSNHGSRKGRHLAANGACALTFLWTPLQRQVCVTGRAERLGEDESTEYFAARPRGSRISAWASEQSTVIADRTVLEERAAGLEARFAGMEDIPKPPFWGGYLVVPETIELWGGRPSRLHDRLRYSRDSKGGWRTDRLSP